MQSTVTVVRAIGAEFMRRTVRPLVIMSLLAAIVLVGIGGWLTTYSAWWWLLEVVLISGSLLLVVLLMVVRAVLRRVEPSLSATQKKSVVDFVDKLERVTSNVQTPQIVIMYYVIRDTIRPRPDSFVETVSHDSKTLTADFARLRKQFK